MPMVNGKKYSYTPKGIAAAKKAKAKLKAKPKAKPKTKAKKKKFPDLNKDGKITRADILKGRGVKAKAKPKRTRKK